MLLFSQLLGDKSVVGIANCVVFGTRGRLGRLLKRAWIQKGVSHLFADPCDLRAPGSVQVTDLQGRVVMCLAGVTPASKARVGQTIYDNQTIAEGMMQIAADGRAAGVLFLSSIAVYGAKGAPWAEDADLLGHSAYARAKIAMEKCVFEMSSSLDLPATCLRLGNVAGADAALGGWTEGAQMDVFANGRTPLRSYIGPKTLVDALDALATQVTDLPPVLNLGSAPAIEMGDLLDAAQYDWTARPAARGALAHAELDLTRLRLVLGPLSQTSAQSLVAEVAAL